MWTLCSNHVGTTIVQIGKTSGKSGKMYSITQDRTPKTQMNGHLLDIKMALENFPHKFAAFLYFFCNESFL